MRRILAATQSVRNLSSSSRAWKLPSVITPFIDNNVVEQTEGDQNEKCAESSRNISFLNRAPFSGDVLCRVQFATSNDVNKALSSSRAAHAAWSALPSSERGEFLYEAANLVEKSQDELAYWEALDSGIPISQIQSAHLPCVIETLRYYAAVATTGLQQRGSSMDTPKAGGHPDAFCYTRRESLGVCVGIGAWNYPLLTMTWKLAPALACGNSFIYKPSECTPLTAVLLAQKIFSPVGLPPGVLQILPGGRETGMNLVLHPKVAKVSLTGSTASGIKVAELGSKTLKRMTLELGGKSPLIVFSDSDLDSAVNVAIMGNFVNNGQVCSNCTRVYVDKSISEEFVQKLCARLNDGTIRMGDNMNPTTNVGPVMLAPSPSACSVHYDRIITLLEGALSSGNVILVHGGKGITGNGGGYFVEPTVLLCDHDDLEVVREEIFGPVMVILTFDSEAEVIERANRSKYGLAAGIMTNNLARAHRVAKRLEAGTVWVNNCNLSPIEMPFGPYKMSGYGKECGMEALDHYSQVKTVYIEMGEVKSSDTYFSAL